MIETSAVGMIDAYIASIEAHACMRYTQDAININLLEKEKEKDRSIYYTAVSALREMAESADNWNGISK